MQSYLRPSWCARRLTFLRCQSSHTSTQTQQGVCVSFASGFQPHGALRLSSTSSDHPEGQELRGDSSSALWAFPVYASDKISDKRSVFLAHASRLPDASYLPGFLDHIAKSSALKKATHFMYAYRTVKSPTDAQEVVGQSDGGESGSGDRLTRLLELSKAERVVIVVSRWYGGVQLGSARWKRISDVAKQALERGDFVHSGGSREAGDDQCGRGTSRTTRKKR